MLQTTNKKTMETFEVITIGERDVVLKSVDTQEVKNTTVSTLKRWYTKPQEVKLQQVEQVDLEQITTCVQEVQEPQQVQEPALNEQQVCLQQMIDFALQNGCTTWEKSGHLYLKLNNLRIVKISGKKEIRFFVSGKKISEQTAQQLTKQEYVGHTLTSYTKITNIELCKTMLLETIQFEQNKKNKTTTK